jgi:hypothetical protein
MNSSASKVREIVKDFLEQNVGRSFKRKELEDFIDERVKVTSGSKTGAINRMLIENGSRNGVQKLDRGVFIYDPTKTNEATRRA